MSETVGYEVDALRGRAAREMHVYELSGQRLFVRDGAERTGLYKRAGATRDPETMADHDGPVLLDSRFFHVEESDRGAYVAYHPYAGRGPILGHEPQKDAALLLEEVEKVV